MADIVNPGQAASVLNQEALPANVDLYIYKGDYVDVRVEIKDNSGNPVTLTGLTPSAQLRENYDSITGTDFTCTVTNDGKIKIYMSSAVTSGLTSGSYIWDFQLTDENGDNRTYFTGDVTVSREVTRT